LLGPPGPRAPEQSSNGLWAAKQAGAKHVVRMSAVNAAFNAPTINSRLHALSDAEVAASGIPYTILKPHFFAQNLIMMAAGSIAQDGAMYMAMGEGRVGIIDSRDISDFAAHVLTHPGHEGKTYTLTGPASLNMHQVSEAIGKGIGKPVKYIPIPVEAAQQAMTQMGMDPWMINFLSDYMKAYSSNWGDFANGEFQRVTGKAPRGIDQFVRDFAGAFGKK
ncbi:MAG: NmrA family NAD(P)-binding protein, partial [Fibrobacteria bacterium]